MLTFLNFRSSSPTYSKIQTDLSPTPSEDGRSKEQLASELGEIDPKCRSWLRRHWVAIAVHSLLGIMNLIVYLVASRKTWDPAHAHTPLKHAIEYEYRVFEDIPIQFHNGTLNPKKPTNFGGKPRPALDAAWRKLTKNQNIYLTEKDLGQPIEDDTVIQLTDGSGAFATLTVYHGLHCMERLHHYLYPEHYYSSFSDDEKLLLKYHAEHCLNWLRQYLTCNADTTPIMMHWIAESALPIAKVDGGSHSCVNWDRIDEWAEKRTFVPSGDNMKHPIYGNPYGAHVNQAIGLVKTNGHHYVSSDGTINT